MDFHGTSQDVVRRAGGPLTRAAGVTVLGDVKIGPRGSETNILAPSFPVSLCFSRKWPSGTPLCFSPSGLGHPPAANDHVTMAMRQDNGRAVDPADCGWMEEGPIQRC